MDKCSICKSTADCQECCSCCGRANCHCGKDIGLLLIRLALAAVFIFHGWDKLAHMDMVVGFFAGLGFPAALAWLVALGEFGAGIAMLLGVFTRWAGYVLALIMLVAIIKVKYQMGFSGGYEFDLVLLLSALGIAFSGPGSYALIQPRKCCQSCASKDAPR